MQNHKNAYGPRHSVQANDLLLTFLSNISVTGTSSEHTISLYVYSIVHINTMRSAGVT